MEATAIYNFESGDADEMSFKQKAVLKILNRDDQSWFIAECEGREGHIPSNYIHLEDPPWYKGKITRGIAEECLLKMTASGESIQPDGAFLIRKSEADKLGHSLSVKHGYGVQHFKILQDETGKYYLWKKKFFSINELVNYYRTNSVSREAKPEIILKDMIPDQRIVCKCQAKYKFTSEDDDELDFQKDDIINVLEKVDDNWWRGELNGNTGLIPSNYVREI